MARVWLGPRIRLNLERCAAPLKRVENSGIACRGNLDAGTYLVASCIIWSFTSQIGASLARTVNRVPDAALRSHLQY